jgi:hypothetical protein
MALSYRNRQFISDKHSEIGQALDDIIEQISSVARQTNSSLSAAETPPPPTPSQLVVTASQGIFEARIHDTNPVNRGINYFLEYSRNPAFNSPITVDLGQARNYRGHLGNQILYWRAHSSYPTSQRSYPVYHGTSINPIAVVGGGAIMGPEPLDSSGSGTSYGGTGTDGGFGNFPTRTRIQ